MSAFTITSVRSVHVGGMGAQKRAVIECTGPASYDTNGSVIDLSSANTVLTGLNNESAFTAVRGVARLGVSPHASDKYMPAFVPGASGSPSTGTIKLRDLSAASDAEVASTTDLSATTFVFEVCGV